MPDRQAEREEIRRLLLGGRSLQMLAPRRIGKTWLMRRVAEDLAADGWITISSDVEGMRSEEQFLRDLCAKIAEQESYGKQVFHHLGQRLKQITSGTWEGGPVQAIGRVDPKAFVEALIASLDAEGRDTVILVDEIALFVSRLLANDAAKASDFLYHLRKLRQSYPRVRWILTGSIGLDVVARRGNLLGAMVDLDILPIDPFDEQQARAYLDRLCAANDVRRPFALDDGGFHHLARELGWLAPYYLRLIADRIRPSGTATDAGRPLALVADIDGAFEELLKPYNRGSFSTWEEHIDKNFPPEDAVLLQAILEICCEQPEGETFATLQTRLSKTLRIIPTRDVKNMLTALANDGLLHEADGRWRFRSGLLRRYWMAYLHP
jgi:hypothetical protein